MDTIYFQKLFEEAPGPYLILQPNLVIAAVNDAYLSATMTCREDISGRHLFDVFPDNPDDVAADGVSNLRNSLNIVLQTRKPHSMPLQKYDIRRPDGSFELRYWSPLNIPVPNEKGDVQYIIHHVEDVTEITLLKNEDKRQRKELEETNEQLLNEIDERKKAEEKIRENEQMFSDFFYKSPVMQVISDIETGIMLEVNDAYANFLQIPKEEMIGKTTTELKIAPAYDRSKVIAKLKQDGFIRDLEMEIFSRNGASIWISAGIDIVTMKGKKCLLTASTNITKRKEADAIIQKLNSELEKRVAERTAELGNMLNEVANYKYALDASSIISITDEKGIIVHVNDNFCNITKSSRDEMVGQDHFICNSGYHSKELMQQLWQDIQHDKIWKGELKNKAKDGTYYWVDTTIVPLLNEAGKPYRYMAIRADITERKKLEEQQSLFVSIVDSSHDAIISKTLDGIITSWNHGAEKIFGYSAHEIIGKHISLLIPPHLKKEETDIMIEIKNGKVVDNFETVRIRKDKQLINVSLTISPIIDLMGTITGASKILRDTTERKKIEEKIIEEKAFSDSVIESLPGIFYMYDSHLTFIRWNKNFEIFSGYSGKEIIKMNPLDFFDDDEKKDVATEINNVFEKGFSDIEAHFFTKSKKKIAFYFNGRRADFDGKTCLLGMGIDISELKAARDEVSKREQLFRSTLDMMMEGVQIYDLNWRCVYVNDAAIGQSPFTKKQVMEKSLLENYPGIEHTELFKIFEDCKTGRFSKTIEYEFVFANGSKRWFDFSIQPNPEGIFILTVDITEKKKAETELKESEHKYRSLIEEANDAICIADSDTSFIDVNPGGHNLLGYSKEEFLKLSPCDVVFEEDMATNPLQIEQLKLGKPIRVERRLKRKDGSAVYVEASGKMLQDGRFLLFARDITERKEAEAKIENLNRDIVLSERKFRGLIENSQDFIGLINGQNEVTYRSPSHWRNFGWTQKEFEQEFGMQIPFDMMHPDDRETIRKIANDAHVKVGTPLRLRYRIRHRNGQYRWMDGTITNMLHDESIKSMITNLRDVTETVEAEHRIRESEKIYRTIAANIPGSVIFLMDTDYRYLLVEGDLIEKLGYSKGKLLGQKAMDVLQPDRYAEMLPHFIRMFKGEAHNINIDRGSYQLAARFVPLKNDNNESYAGMALIIDVTELKKAEKELAEINAMLEQKVLDRTMELEIANKELESFSYSVSHDLRAPLRAISGYSMIMLEDFSANLNSEGNRILNKIISNSTQMGKLIDNLLMFSRMGREAVALQPVNMRSVIQSCINELLSPETENRYTFQIGNIPNADADAAMIKQVWMNLISNAIKYSSKKEKPFVKISATTTEGFHVYCICDNGSGFDMQYANKLFGVFQRLHRNEEFEGTGVGLALVNRIILKHNGTIWAESVVNAGATFYFSLPATNSDEQKNKSNDKY